MDTIWKAVAAVLLTSVLTLTLEKQGKDIAVLLAMAVCAMLGILAVRYLEPVLDLIRELGQLGSIQDGILGNLMKAVGIGLVSGLAELICADSGNASLGKMLQFLGSALILSLAVPVIESLLTLIQEILGGL